MYIKECTTRLTAFAANVCCRASCLDRAVLKILRNLHDIIILKTNVSLCRKF